MMTTPQRMSLDGVWHLSQPDRGLSLSASVPGCVHLDLLRAGEIPDPYFRENERVVAWVGEVDWLYERNFDLPAEWAASGGERFLVFEGLDTIAEVSLNGHLLGITANMFRRYEFPLSDLFEKGNHLSVRFRSPLEEIAARQADRFMTQEGVIEERVEGSSWLRKEQCNFGWDWGPKLVTSGIWRSVWMERRVATLADPYLLQEWTANGAVVLSPQFSVEGEGAARIEIELTGPTGALVLDWSFAVDASESRTLSDPQLWWPRGLGEAALYGVQFNLLGRGGELLDSTSFRLGLRRFELVRSREADGESFTFRINGVSFFAKGANWIPADCFDARVSDADLEDLLRAAVHVHMNMVRVWGGGLYERERFYELCDEMGLCVWQDFLFACAAYPLAEADFEENVTLEAREALRRLRRHASVVFWCGNNEIEQMHLRLIGDGPGAMSWPEYTAAFDDLLGGLVAAESPETPYWPSSPHSTIGARTEPWDERSGDAHVWSVWHGREPFAHYRTSRHRFISEFGFQSFPEMRTIRSFATEEDLAVESSVMKFHQRSGIGNSVIRQYLESWFSAPERFEDFVSISQILQALALKYGVEHWRRMAPHCMGTLYWQLNDTWPGPSWSTIDSEHRWKAAHYEARRFYAPVLISIVEDLKSRAAEVFLTADANLTIEGIWSYRWETLSGQLLEEGEHSCCSTPGATLPLASLKAREEWTRELILWVEFRGEDGCISRNFTLFARPCELSWEDPGLRWEVSGEGREVVLHLNAERPVPWVWLSAKTAEIRWEDNYFSLRTGERRVLRGTRFDASKDGDESVPEIEVRTLFDCL